LGFLNSDPAPMYNEPLLFLDVEGA
jgi:hypothetical protein